MDVHTPGREPLLGCGDDKRVEWTFQYDLTFDDRSQASSKAVKEINSHNIE